MLLRPVTLAQLVLAVVSLCAGEPPPPAKTFESPEAAWKALVETLGSGDWKALEALIDPDAVFTLRPAWTPERMRKTAGDLGEAPLKVDLQGDQATFLVGGRPFPVAARKTAKGWVLGDNQQTRAEQAALKKNDVLFIVCGLKLQQIQVHLDLYARKNGKMPGSLEELTKDGADPHLQPSKLLCPKVAEGKHRPGAGGVPCDYLYLPLKPTAPKNAILAFCPKRNHPDRMRACVFRDGTLGKIEDEAEFRTALTASLEAAGIHLESQKAGGAPEGSPAQDPEWLKAIRAELGLDGDKPPSGKSPSEAKPAVKKRAAKKAGAE